MLHWILVAYLAIPDQHLAIRDFPTEVACRRALVEFNEDPLTQIGKCITNDQFYGEGR